jgi:hypothetical protein
MKMLFAIILGLSVMVIPARGGVDANGNKTAEIPEEPALTNWITLGLGNVWVDGDAPAFQHRQGQNQDLFGGIEDLHWEPKISDNVSLRIDGHALGGTEDYLADIELTLKDVGYLKVGYKKFRTWYDGHGGFYPSNDLFFNLYDNDLSIDRENIWVELGLRIPKWPEITFRYEHEARDGTKDSTIWGDTNLTGLTSNAARGIVPTFLNIDEMRDTFTLDLKHTFGQTEVGAGGRYEKQEFDDSRNIHRRPGESADRFVTQHDRIDSDLFSAHAYLVSRFGTKVTLSVAYMFTTLDSDIGGSRIYGNSYDPIFDPIYARRQQRDEGFLNMMGGSDLDQHVTTFNLAWRPNKDWTIIPSFRYEHNNLHSLSEAIETNVASTGAAVTAAPVTAESQRDYDSVTESIEARFTGVKQWTFYAKGEWMQEDLTQTERDFELEEEIPFLLIGRDTDGEIRTQKYVIGANWYPKTWLNMATQYYRKIHDNHYDHPFDTTSNALTSSNRYPAFLRDQEFDVDDFNVRVTWRPISNFTSVSRYDFQHGTTDTRGDLLNSIQSADINAHILSETITWNPFPRLYLQGSISYVRNETDTPADQLVPNLPVLVLDMRNDYWNGTITAGYALGDKTDLQVSYFYYRADDFQDNSSVSQPYGEDAEEQAVTAVLSHEFSRNIIGKLRYGYFTNRTDAYGGVHNYDAHVVGASLQYRF